MIKQLNFVSFCLGLSFIEKLTHLFKNNLNQSRPTHYPILKCFFEFPKKHLRRCFITKIKDGGKPKKSGKRQ
jgi:hypothetical protein